MLLAAFSMVQAKKPVWKVCYWFYKGAQTVSGSLRRPISIQLQALARVMWRAGHTQDLPEILQSVQDMPGPVNWPYVLWLLYTSFPFPIRSFLRISIGARANLFRTSQPKPWTCFSSSKTREPPPRSPSEKESFVCFFWSLRHLETPLLSDQSRLRSILPNTDVILISKFKGNI